MNPNLLKNLRILPLCGLLLSGLLNLAIAQNGIENNEDIQELSPFEVDAEGDVGYYADNSVSATKTRVQIRDLPMNLQIMTEEFISDVQASEIDEALEYAAAVHPATNEPGRFAFRGFITETPMRNGIATLAESNFASAGTVQRLEIVKGPSAILYGITEPGGLVNIITKKPRLNRRTSIEARYGEEGSYQFEFDTTGPIGETDGKTGGAYRFIALAEQLRHDSWFAEDDIYTIAPSLSWNFTENTSILATIEHQILNKMPQGAFTIKVDPNTGNRIGFIPGFYYDVPSEYNGNGPDAYKDTDSTFASVDFQHRFWDERFTFRAVVNHVITNIDQDTRVGDGVEGAGPADIGEVRYHFLQRLVDRNETTIQAEIAGEWEAMGGTHNLLFGVETTEFEQDQVANRANNVIIYPWDDPSQWNFAITIPPEQRTINPANFVYTQDTASAYAMFQSELVDGRLNTLLGVRYDKVEASTFDRSSSNRSGDPETTNTTPQVGAIFDMTDSVSVFASYSESFSPNTQVNPDGSTFDPATGEGLEAGFKFSFYENRLNGTLSAFTIDKTNIVRVDQDRSNATNQLWYNTSGLERSEGFELDLSYAPNDNWQMVFSYAHMDVRIVENSDSPAEEGRRPPGAPEDSVAFWTKYTFTEGRWDGLYIAGGVTAVDDKATNTSTANIRLRRPAYTKVDAVIGYKFNVGDQRWQVTLKGNNLLDEFYFRRQNWTAQDINFQLGAKVIF